MRHGESAILVGMVGAMAIIALRPAMGQETKGTETAKKTLSQFWSKIEAQDQEGLLKTVDVPFCFSGNLDKFVEKVITDREDLKKLMKELLDGAKGKKSQLTIVATLTYPEFLKETGDLLKKDGPLKKDRQALDEVLKRDGYVMMTKVREGKEDAYPMGFLVASPNGEAKLVGILIGLTIAKK